MSNIPYADLGETSGERSGNVVVDEPDLAANSSDDDKLSETGDIGVSDDVCASYQEAQRQLSSIDCSQKDSIQTNLQGSSKTALLGGSFVRGENMWRSLGIHHDYDNEEDLVNINSSLKPRHSTSYIWLRHPKVRENWKTVTGAIFLLIIGISFLICGIVLAAIPDHDGPKAVIFFVCAAVCILPGGYHTVYIYRATKGWRGYTFESLPSFR